MKLRNTLLTLLAGIILGSPVGAQEIVDTWKYTFRKPGENWQAKDFDASKWQEGHGGFGTADTPGARVGKTWSGRNIWLRKTVDLQQVPDNPGLLIHFDEDVEVYINGQQVFKKAGYTTEYQVIPLPADKQSAIRQGENVIAVHCKQTGGGQFIDVHLIDTKNVPDLPTPKRDTQPYITDLLTPWGEEVTAQNAWTEYPRPQMAREDWQNLNGQWDYAISQDADAKTPSKWSGKILVPFCLESKLGGVQRLLDPSETLWYHRTFDAKKAEGERTILHFEAVDYRCDAFVNGKKVGSHVGGNVPFSFDVTDALKSGSNELTLRVDDDTEGFQLRGKQVLNPQGIWYTQVSGIWQTVWLENVPASYVEDLKITTDAEAGSITVAPTIAGEGSIQVVVKDGEQTVGQGKGSDSVTIAVPKAKLWSPQSPHLYNLEIKLLDGSGKEVDRVESYAGIRSVGKTQDADGNWRMTLNGQVIFHWGPLDQGWWPDGLLTPPSDEAMLFDIEYLKQAGFNMIRKHIKVEPRRYYYHCDRLGMMLWQDQVSGGVAGAWPEWTRLQPNPKDAQWPKQHHEQFMTELERMIDHLESHPSIVCWVPFNEAWGQHLTVDVGRWTEDRDPTRLVNIASGGNFWPAGDIVDAHAYPHPEFPFDQGAGGRFDDFIKVMGEFGGHGYPIPGHLWDADRDNWGYGGLPKNESEYRQRYLTSLEKLAELRKQGIAAGVYTQTTDVEGEINGLMTYDRRVIKIPADELAKIHQQKLGSLTEGSK